jgi:hypothetical protein
MERNEILRKYGFLPEMARPSVGPVRSRLTTGSVVGQWFGLITVVGLQGAPGLYFLLAAPDPKIAFGLGGLCIAFAVHSGFAIARDANQWVEVDGDTLRWKHLYSRRVNERDISEIDAVVTMTLPRMPGLTAMFARRVVEGMFGRVKGFEFRFRDMKHGVRIFRADPAMTNVSELLEAAVTSMCKYGDVVPETVDLNGTPLIRRLTLTRR